MLTAKDVREIKFSRSMGGYKTTEVDDFLDLCADTIEELTRQNDENSRKMQVLAETIVDYRNQEDSIRSALISAQRMSESVIADAKAQAEDILATARAEAAQAQEKAVADAAAEREELNRIRHEVAAFKAKLLATYREHLTMIGVLEGAQEEARPEETAAEVAPDAPAAEQEEQSAYREVPDISAFTLVDDE